MKRSLSRTTRLSKIEAILISHAKGLRRSDLAKKLGVSRATIGRDVDDLSLQLPVIEDDYGLLTIDKKSFLNTVRLDAGEIQAIHIACRLLAKNIHFPYPSAASALRKLGNTLEKYKFSFSKEIVRSAVLFDYDNNSRENKSSIFLEILTDSMVMEKAVEINYFSRRKNQLDNLLIHPYQIEPYSDGNSLHVIGYSPKKEKILSFKFENITEIILTDKKYSIPDDFDFDIFYQDAWGIWIKDEDAELVKLLFSENVKKRVCATVWHRCEEREEREDGFLIWKCRISAPEEMVPWIRGWGSDVEVLAPEWLREIIAEEAERTVRLYRSV